MTKYTAGEYAHLAMLVEKAGIPHEAEIREFASPIIASALRIASRATVADLFGVIVKHQDSSIEVTARAILKHLHGEG